VVSKLLLKIRVTIFTRDEVILDDFKEKKEYCKLEEETLARTAWGIRFGRLYGPVVRQTTEDHISNQRDATFYAHLLIATHSTCFGRHSSIIRSSRNACAAYGTVMLIYVMTGSTILSMWLWLMSYNIMWMFIGCGLRDTYQPRERDLVTHKQ
jgi:hypothetical protein